MIGWSITTKAGDRLTRGQALHIVRVRLRAGPMVQHDDRIEGLSGAVVLHLLADLVNFGEVVLVEGHRHNAMTGGFPAGTFGPRATASVCQCESGRTALRGSSSTSWLYPVSVYISTPGRCQDS